MNKTATARTLVIVFLAMALLAASKPANGVTVPENSWTTKSPIPQAIGGERVASANGKIYIMAGSLNFEYDPSTDNWTAKTPMPTPRDYFGITVYQDRIYAIGGRAVWNPETASGHSNANEVYNPLTDTWEIKTSMPTNRSDLCANLVEGKIYLVGGRSGGQKSTVATNEVYDIANDSWTTKKPIPYAVVGYSSAVVDNRIYVIGGQDEFLHGDAMNVGFNQIYDPATDNWSFGASLPTIVWNAAAGATTGVMAPKRIYVVGGLPSKSIEGTNLTQVYDPENDTWTRGEPMPTARAWLAVTVVNDVLYAIGGFPGLMLPSLRENEQYTPFGYGTIPPEAEPFPIIPVAVASGISLAVAAIGLVVYWKKRKR